MMILILITFILYFYFFELKIAIWLSFFNLVLFLIANKKSKTIKIKIQKKKEVYKIISHYYANLFSNNEYVFDKSLLSKKTLSVINEQNDMFNELDSYYDLEEFSVFKNIIFSNQDKRKKMRAIEELMMLFNDYKTFQIEFTDCFFYNFFAMLILCFIKTILKSFYEIIVNESGTKIIIIFEIIFKCSEFIYIFMEEKYRNKNFKLKNFIISFLIYLNIYFPYVALEKANEEAEKNQYYQMKNFINLYNEKNAENIYSLINSSNNLIYKKFVIFCAKTLIKNNYHPSLYLEKKELFFEISSNEDKKIGIEILLQIIFIVFYIWLLIILVKGI